MQEQIGAEMNLKWVEAEKKHEKVLEDLAASHNTELADLMATHQAEITQMQNSQ